MIEAVTETSELAEDHDEVEQKTEESDVERTTNFEADDIDSSIIEKVKGDAIGKTLYSERFVLSTLMKLTKGLEKSLQDDEDYENDLCTLWDQTVEPDVIKFLLEYNCLEIFASALNTEDVRLTEILVGIIANMCATSETRNALETNPEVTCTLISLINMSDSLVLLQLMRLFQAMLVFENSGDELIWFQYFCSVEDFVEKFAFILCSSTSNTLLKHSLDALYAICAKFAVIEENPKNTSKTFTDFFVNATLVTGLIEAFKQVIGLENNCEQEDFTYTENAMKFASVFLEVNVILSQYEKSMQAFCQNMDDFLKCLDNILAPLCQKIYLFPVTNIQQGIIENIGDVLQVFSYPFYESLWRKLIIIYNLFEDSKPNKIHEHSEWDDEDSQNGTENISIDDIQQTVLECLVKVTLKRDATSRVVSEDDKEKIEKLLRNVKTEQDIEEKEFLMFRQALQSCLNKEN